MKVSQKVLQDVSDLAQVGLSASEVSQKLPYGNSTVYRAWKALGLPLQRDRGRTERKVQQLYDEGLDPDQIASAVGCSRAHVYLVLSNLGLTVAGHGVLFSIRPYQVNTADPLWYAQFRGFFYGEGCAFLETVKGSFRPAMVLSQRADQEATLKEIRRVFGGQLTYKPPKRVNRSPQWRWSVFGWSSCKVVIETAGFLEDDWFPHSKRDQVVFLHKAIVARTTMPLYPAPENLETLRAYQKHLSEMKRYRL